MKATILKPAMPAVAIVPGRGLVLAVLVRVLWAVAFVLFAFQAQAGVIFTSLHSFSISTNGAAPTAGLVSGGDGNFYGTTPSGGTNGFGTVFKITTNGTLTTLYSFTGGNDGANPQGGLAQGSDGNFYGTTFQGGTNLAGTVFKITSDGDLTSLYSFTGGYDGANPHDVLAQGNDGNFYGATETGGSGTNRTGTVFKISPSGALSSLYSFTGGNDGAYPHAGLVQGSDGNFYGTTFGYHTTFFGMPSSGSNYGTVFKISTSGALTTLYSFTSGNDGANPYAGLAQGSDGNFYGTTEYGGTNGFGTVFKITSAGVLTSLYSFTGGIDGGSPQCRLAQGSDGNFYGTTEQGGTNLSGTVFKITTAGALTSLYSFIYVKFGANPSGLAQGSDGNFYGTTEDGATDNIGTVFKISPAGALSSLFSFTHANDGTYPQGGLAQGSDGNFYGTTYDGGTNHFGTVFKITASGALISLYSFTGGDDGANPHAVPAQGRDGNVYGTTPYGGVNGFGTVFKITAGGALISLYSFTGVIDGRYPVPKLALGSDGNFYGMTYEGGTSDQGTVFRISAGGALTSLYSFTGGIDGAYPQAGLTLGNDGNFYGTTYLGGTNSFGTVFKLGPNGALTSLYSFTGGYDGAKPLAGVVQGRDGNFYGTTYGGGTNGFGTVFKITPNGTLTSLYSFTWGNYGPDPHVELTQGGDGNFYGTTSSGGTNGLGTVFKISAGGVLTSLYSFTGGVDGRSPVAGLLQGSDGSFYGTTEYGGSGGAGTVFRLTLVPPPAPVFQGVNLTNGAVSLSWSTEATERYQLQYNSDLSSSNWTNLGDPMTATAATLQATDSAATNGPQRFYRVVLLP